MAPSRLVAVLIVLASTYLPAQDNPVPFIDQPLVPSAAPPGGQGFTLTVNGGGFVSGSVVYWSGVPLVTTFVSNTQVTALVDASNISSARTVSVTAINPVPGGGVSNIVFFPISNPVASVQLAPKGNSLSSVGGEVTADFNNDGKLDLAVTSFSPPQVMVFLGNGDGSFQPAKIYLDPGESGPLGLGDFNGDGKLDLVTADALFLGNGDGTFQPGVSLAGILPAYGFIGAVGDFNGDGKLDVAGESDAPQAPALVFVALGNGDGTFQTGITSGGCGYDDPDGSVVATDLNNDGNLDLIIGDYDTGICVFLGNGDGTFSGNLPVAGPHPLNWASADFNADGKQDLLISHGNDGLDIYLGNGDGTFQDGPFLNPGNCTLTTIPIVPGDFNADGKLDFAFGNCIFLGNGDGTFQLPQEYPLPPTHIGFTGSGDFNGDGTLDLLSSWTIVNLQVVQPLVSLSPSSLDFGPILFGKSSGPQDVTLRNVGNANLKISSIGFSGANPTDFGQTNTCGTSLAVNSECQISVTFGPKAGGTLQASLQIADNAPGSPHLVPVKGIGEDFSLSISPPSMSVAPGQTANYALTVTPMDGFNQSVTLTCTGAPSGSTCTISPSTVMLNGSKAVMSDVAVTTGSGMGLTQRLTQPPDANAFAAWFALLGFLGLATAMLVPRRALCRQARYVVTLCCLAFIGLTMPACGGGSASAGSHTLTVTGTYNAGSAQLTHSVTVTLNVR